MPRRSPSRPGAVYRMTVGVTEKERNIIRATAQRFGMGTGEILWLWIYKQVERYAEDPLVQEWIASYVPEKPETPAEQERTKAEVLEIIKGED